MKTRRWIRLIAGNMLVLVLILSAIEGGASYLLVFRDILATRSIAERRHTQYDAELGWINRPNITIPDMYGPGISLETNSQGFRADHDFSIAVRPGTYRAICSGDSFTLGYGVSDEAAWCQWLTRLDPRLETVNMGQGGYGLDQAYLWYKRDGLKFEHQIHLLAVITLDFERMLFDEFLGYPKPVLDIENGALVVRNVPVPRRAYRLPWLTAHVEHLRQLRTVEFLSRLWNRGAPSRELPQTSVEEDTRKMRALVSKILEDLKREDDLQRRRLVLVYLPEASELNGDDPQEWINFLKSEAETRGILFVNVLESFRTLPDAEAMKMFIPEGQINYPGAAFHLSNLGNQRAAELIYRSLQARE